MSLVWSLDLPDSQKIVLLALADCANDEGHCWPSMASLSKKCSKGERTIQGVVKELVAAGHLTRKEVPGKGCNYYVHPRSRCAPATPADSAPRRTCAPQGTTQTPAAAADKPSRTIINKTKGTRAIPDDWQPREFGKATKSKAVVDGWPPGEIETQTERFVAHHRARGNEFVDWQDAWSTWVLNSVKFRNSRNDRTARPASEEVQNPYVRAVVARQAARAGDERGQPDSWP